MSQMVVGAAATVAGLALAGAFLAPTLTGTPVGEPMTVAGPADPYFHHAGLAGGGCADRLVAAADLLAAHPVGFRLIALSFAGVAGAATVAADEVLEGGLLPGDALLVVLDPSGQAISAGTAAELAGMEPRQVTQPGCQAPPRDPPEAA